MLLKDYCLTEFYAYHGLKYAPPAQSSDRYADFRGRLNSLLPKHTVTEMLYRIIPALYSAASTESGSPEVDAEINEYFSGYKDTLADDIKKIVVCVF